MTADGLIKHLTDKQTVLNEERKFSRFFVQVNSSSESVKRLRNQSFPHLGQLRQTLCSKFKAR